MKKLELYTSTTCKNGVDICNSLKQDWLLTSSPPELNENHDHTAGDVQTAIKQEALLEVNLEAMYMVVLSICEDHVCNSKAYVEIDNKQDTLLLLRCIKKIMYSNGNDDTHMGNDHVFAINNFYHIQQECHQSL